MPNTTLLVINDPHTAVSPPFGRTDDYCDQVLAKLSECWEIACDVEASAIIITGDIFHKFRGVTTSSPLLVRLLDIFRQAPTAVYSVAGNHDLSSKGIESIWEMPFGVLAKAGAIRWLSEAQLVDDLLLVPRNWQPFIDKIPTIFDLSEKEHEQTNDAARVVMVAHASILPPGDRRPYDHHVADMLPTDNLDVLLCGHLHEDLGIHQLPSGCWFANVGALSRVERHAHNYHRTPSVLAVTLVGEEVEFTQHELKSARPAADVFLVPEEKAVREASEFAAALSEGLEIEEVPFDELLAEHTKDLPEPVAERVRYYLTGVEDV